MFITDFSVVCLPLNFVALLRLVSGPVLFDLTDWQKILKRTNSSRFRFVLIVLLLGPGSIWTALSVDMAKSMPLSKLMLFSSPRLLIGLEAFVFVFGVVVSAEGLLGCVQFALTLGRKWSEA